MSHKVPEASPWQFSTLVPPGYYFDRISRRPVYWSGAPRFITTPEDTEQNGAAQMRALGYFDAETTVRGIDGGIDIHSSAALAQVKRTRTLTGRPELQCLIGAAGRGCTKELWFLSASGYTKLALEYAAQESVLLFTYEITGELTPVNQIAKDRYGELLAQRARRVEMKRIRRAGWRAQKYGPRYPQAPAIPAGAFPVLEEV